MRIQVVVVSLVGSWLVACTDGAECNSATDCPADSVCVESQCRVVCNRNSDCPAGQYCVEGTCSEVECVPGARCDDGNPCTEYDECDVLGSCVGLPVVCDQIPSPECVDADTRRTYSAGSCQGGECVYPYSDASCPDCPSCDPTACTIGEDSFSSRAVNPADGCEFCDLANPTTWTGHACDTESFADPCQAYTGTCDPTLDSSSCQLDDCCQVEPSWPTGSTSPAPSCPLGQEDTDHDGIEDDGETWTGSCTHDGGCAGCSMDSDCDDSDPCSVDTCSASFCGHDWTTRLGQACTFNSGDDGRCVDVGSRAECKLINGEPCNPEEPGECQDGSCGVPPDGSCGPVSCASGSAADGYCCNSDCLGECQSCDGSETVGPNGVCANITAGTDPASECTDGLACNGGSCATSCSPSCSIDPNNCEAGNYCDGSNACAPLRSIGTPPDATCGSDSCSSGSAADGYCCDSDCLGECQSCDGSETVGSNGFCSNITAGTDPDPECPAGFACNGGACATDCSPSCGNDPNSCEAGYFCNRSYNCAPLLDNGTPPNAICGSVSCSSGSAADGYCCNNDCLGKCQSCDGSETVGSDGQCSSITPGTDPDSECPGGLACNGGACATICSAQCSIDPNNCEAGSFCDYSNSCVSLLSNGRPPDWACGWVSCSSGYEADGYCCNSACDGVCMSCGVDNDGVAGVCTNIVSGANDEYPSAICVGINGCSTSSCVCDGSGACRGDVNSTGCAVGAECLYGICDSYTCVQP